jgi:hypothetical protein
VSKKKKRKQFISGTLLTLLSSDERVNIPNRLRREAVFLMRQPLSNWSSDDRRGRTQIAWKER